MVEGILFTEIDWLRLAFRDKTYSWDSGNDYSFCAHFRKYTGKNCVLQPVEKTDSSTFVRVVDSTEEDERTRRMSAELARNLLHRGYTISNPEKLWHPWNTVIFVDTDQQVFYFIYFVNS